MSSCSRCEDTIYAASLILTIPWLDLPVVCSVGLSVVRSPAIPAFDALLMGVREGEIPSLRLIETEKS